MSTYYPEIILLILERYYGNIRIKIMISKEQQTLEKQTRKVRTPLIRSFTNCSETTPIEIF